MAKIKVIAIDGPAASGKSTVSQLLAERLNYLYLDTGCMYRAVTLAGLKRGIDLTDEAAVTRLAQEIEIDIHPEAGKGDGHHYTVRLGDEDVTWEIRTPAVDQNVSLVSSYLGVRQEMVQRQRAFGERGQVVMVGRDIGTVVMPAAPLKLYITASASERARRRWHDRQSQGHEADFAAILADVKRRDKIDGSRQHSPMRPAADALIIDTTDKEVPQIVEELMDIIQNLPLGEPLPEGKS